MERVDFVSFEEMYEQNERRIQYHIYKLHMDDLDQDFYVTRLYMLWIAYKKFQPYEGMLSTYFNYSIRMHLIDMPRGKRIVGTGFPVQD
ncbi:hypothetical protein [Oceanobacillus arenosus]|nr:hypothetical protein [Oceanobacillus arenosus]